MNDILSLVIKKLHKKGTLKAVLFFVVNRVWKRVFWKSKRRLIKSPPYFIQITLVPSASPPPYSRKGDQIGDGGDWQPLICVFPSWNHDGEFVIGRLLIEWCQLPPCLKIRTTEIPKSRRILDIKHLVLIRYSQYLWLKANMFLKMT